MPSTSFLERLAEEKRRQRLRELLAELEDELRELEDLESRIALTLARLRLVLEIENRS